MKIYVASSWRNVYQPAVVAKLREVGHEVYDFRNPRPGDNGFSWSVIDPLWQSWQPYQYTSAIVHPVAEAGFKSDFDAMRWADACVLVLPSGRSAHLEAGWFCGQGKQCIVFIPEPVEPELMNKLASHICTNMDGVLAALATDSPIHTGDTVFHVPTGETWLVAYAENGHVVPCGWPCTMAKASECRLTRLASDTEREELLGQLLKINDCSDVRYQYAVRATTHSSALEGVD